MFLMVQRVDGDVCNYLVEAKITINVSWKQRNESVTVGAIKTNE